ncbi:tRNA-uridine aminocarboxypropyltransferase [Neptuniibacter halophilus]|uniref:tRNA-uridine aminocarboxypropyltransferase n=1 Tax=Neptuniibacter halophilus TaxID=651666 RepID=UPI002572A5AD|nr:DTW domain-containing protein [Neptuniibacter halophilus]
MPLNRCSGCGLPELWCCCSQIQPQQSDLTLALLLHQNEPERASSTSRIIRRLLPGCQLYLWQRREPPEALLEQIQSSDVECWLLFPADRPDLKLRSRALSPKTSARKRLIIIPDGTWKEVRKMVRKSPWLNDLPLLAFDPGTPSRYDLRRNPDPDHLCTAETVAELLRLNDEKEAAQQLDQALDLFIQRYKDARQKGALKDSASDRDYRGAGQSEGSRARH